ncbi:hypothetical protein [Streptomyces niveus]
MLTVGGPLGLALLVTAQGRAMRSARENLPTGMGEADGERFALAEGINGAFQLGSVFAVIGPAVAVFAVRARPRPPADTGRGGVAQACCLSWAIPRVAQDRQRSPSPHQARRGRLRGRAEYTG